MKPLAKNAQRPPLGQHFLRDGVIADKIAAAIGARAEDDSFIEIGPGDGALTAILLASGAKKIIAVEIDAALSAALARRFANAVAEKRLEITRADALAFDYAACGSGLRVAGNLPYQISSPLIFALAKIAPQLRDIHIMTQMEFARRLTAKPGTMRGRLSVAAQRVFTAEILFAVSPRAFVPPPRVESAFVRLIPKPNPPSPVCQKVFEDVLRLAFSARRKTLANALSKTYGEALADAPPDFLLSRRAQTLSVAEFVALADYLAAAKSR